MRVGHPDPDAAGPAPMLRGQLTLTATDHLARQLREDANLARARGSVAVWEAPRIASLSRWITDAWTASWPDAQLLSATQERVLWTEAIERDEAGAMLLAPQAAAREARRADQLLRRWHIAVDAAPALLDEHQAFRRWHRRVARRLAQQRWLTAADLPGEVARLIRGGAVAVPDEIALAGFVAPLAPAEQAVIDALEARGTRIERIESAPLAVRVALHRCADPESQWRFVAHRLRERLRAQAQDPPRVVIALPDVEGPRALAESVLRELLAPWSLHGEGAQPWRWERGLPLSEQPTVDTLLALLQLRVEDNRPELISRVLLSASLWTERERALTAAADYALRDRGFPRVRLARLREHLPDALAARFAAFEQACQRQPARALPSEWALQFRFQLEALGWPGSEALDSRSYQAVLAARALLDRLGTLDAQLGRVPRATAREWLAEFALAARHAPRVEHAQPVLITSIEEAAALSADLLIVLDATAAQLPTTARPTPFIALDVQRAAGIPESAPATWLARTQIQLAQLLRRCAPEVLVCAPRVDVRGAELQASSLFGAGAAWSDAVVPRRIGALEAALDMPPLLQPVDDPVPPVDAAEQAALRPDSALFKAWFESPFFAFCAYRLGVEALPQAPRGLDARVQGTLVHEVLEDLWAELREQRALLAMDDATLAARIAAHVEARAARRMPEDGYGAATRRLEIARACDVVGQWLRHERRRIDPFRVELREVRVEAQVAGLALRLRLDRVDRVETPHGERWLVLDYKTGVQADPRGWKAERLEEPQLPLYASHAASAAAGIPRVDGICFGHVKDGHPALVAQTNWRERLIEEPAATMDLEWDERLGAWRLALDNAARGFLAGEAWLAPRVNERAAYAALLALTGATPEDAPE